jgi:hypothetical protein
MVSKQNLGEKEKFLEEIKKDFESKLRTISKMQHYVDTVQTALVTEREVELPDGTMLSINNADTYLKQSQDIVKEKEEMEVKLASMKEENLMLCETVNSLRDKFGCNIDDVLDAHEKMLAIDEESNEANMVKGQTLQQISEIVSEITEILEKERKELEPMVRALEKTY